MIICAAISLTYKNKYNQQMGVIICGHRHCNCFATMQHMDIATKVNEVQGFINHKGEFLNRKEALAHAIECGQLTETHRYYREDNNIDELYSEDLY